MHSFQKLIERIDVLKLFVYRDIAVVYKQSFIGIFWVVIQPVLITAIYAAIFSRVGASSDSTVPYTLYVLSGVIVWIYFAKSLSEGTNSIVANRELIQKTNFPRIFLPMSSVLTPLIDLLVVSLLLILLNAAATGRVSIWILLLPIPYLLLMLLVFGIVLMLSSVNALYRDIAIALPFLLQVGIFTAPIGYPISLISSNWKILIMANPLTGVLDLVRFCFFATPISNFVGVASICVLAPLSFLMGIKTFARIESKVVDQA